MSVNIKTKITSSELDLGITLSSLENDWYSNVNEYLNSDENIIAKYHDYQETCSNLGLYGLNNEREDVLRINDLYFNIPPTSIGVNISNNHIDIPQLRGKTSVKLDTGRGEISLSLSLVFCDNALHSNIVTLENEIKYKLIPLMIQLTTIPFCEISNSYILEKLYNQIQSSNYQDDQGQKATAYSPLMFTYVGYNLSTSPDTPRMVYLHLQFLLFNYYPYINRLFYVKDYARDFDGIIQVDEYGRKYVDEICANPFNSNAFQEFYALEFDRYDKRLRDCGGQSIDSYVHTYSKDMTMILKYNTYTIVPIDYLDDSMKKNVMAKINTRPLGAMKSQTMSKLTNGASANKPKMLPLNINPGEYTIGPFSYYNAYRDGITFRTKDGVPYYHQGIDFIVPEGTPVYSTIKGKVTINKNDKDGYGNYIQISNDTTAIRFAHLKELSFKKVNDEINVDDLIGYVGSTGTSSGAHLHYEVLLWDNTAKCWQKANPFDANILNKDYYSLSSSNPNRTFNVKKLRFSDKKFPSVVVASDTATFKADKNLSATITNKYDNIINEAASKYGVNPVLIKSIISVESGGDPYIESETKKKLTKDEAKTSTKAVGLMQLTPDTGKAYGCPPEDRIDPTKNIMAGTKYLKKLIEIFPGDNDYRYVVMSYNYGDSNVKKMKNGKIAIPSKLSNYYMKVTNYMKLYGGDNFYSNNNAPGEYTDESTDSKEEQKKKNYKTIGNPTEEQLITVRKQVLNALNDPTKYELAIDHNSLKNIYIREFHSELIQLNTKDLVLLGIESSGMHNVPRIPISGYQYSTHQYVGGQIKTISLNMSSISKIGDMELAKIQKVMDIVENNARKYSSVAAMDGIQIIEPYINTVLGATHLALSNLAIETDDTAPGVSNIALQMTDFTFAKEFAKKEYRFDFEKRRHSTDKINASLIKRVLDDLFHKNSEFSLGVRVSECKLPVSSTSIAMSNNSYSSGNTSGGNYMSSWIDGGSNNKTNIINTLQNTDAYNYIFKNNGKTTSIKLKFYIEEKNKQDSPSVEYTNQKRVFWHLADYLSKINNVQSGYVDAYDVFQTLKDKASIILKGDQTNGIDHLDKWKEIFGYIGNPKNKDEATALYELYDDYIQKDIYYLLTLYADFELSLLDEFEKIYSSAYNDFYLPPTINPDYYFYSENTMILSSVEKQKDVEKRKNKAADDLKNDYETKWRGPFAASDFFNGNENTTDIPATSIARKMVEGINTDYFTGGPRANFQYNQSYTVTGELEKDKTRTSSKSEISSSKETANHFSAVNNAIIGYARPANEDDTASDDDAYVYGEFSLDSNTYIDNSKIKINSDKAERDSQGSDILNNNRNKWLAYGDDVSLARNMHYEIAKENSKADNVVGMHMAFPVYKVYVMEDDTDESLAWTRQTDLNDFYGLNSIVELKVSMHNDQPADMLIVRFVDMTGKFSSAKHKAYHGTESKALDKRDVELENPLRGLMLQEGTKIQCRMGYSNNINNLPIVFNGQIVSIEQAANEYTLMCQSFGTELVYDVKNPDGPKDITQFNAETKEILNWAITRPEIKNFGRWKLRGNSKYFVNSGEVAIAPGTYVKLRPDGTTQRVWSWLRTEADLNILAPEESPWQGWDLIATSFKESPFNTVFQVANGPANFFKALFKAWNSSYYVYRMTPWDIITDMTYRYPGYVAKVLPYEDRNTLFYGPPDAPYYARAYTMTENIKMSKLSDELSKANKELNEKRNTDEYKKLLVLKKAYDNTKIEFDYYNNKKNEWYTTTKTVRHIIFNNLYKRWISYNEANKLAKALGYSDSNDIRNFKNIFLQYSNESAQGLIVNDFYKTYKDIYNKIYNALANYTATEINPAYEKNYNIVKQYKGCIKTMRQRHVASSMRNISANYIKADYRDVYTKATVHYSVPTDFERSKAASWGDYSWSDGTVNIAMNDFILEEDYRTIEVVRQNIVTEDAAYRAGAHELWWQSKKLYKGELLMLGNPNIKPFDIINLLDYHSEMYGPIEVQTHILSIAPGEGMLSLIVPGMVSRFSDLVSMSMADAEEYIIKEQAKSDMDSEAPSVPWLMKQGANLSGSIEIQNTMTAVSGAVAMVGLATIFTAAAFMAPTAILFWGLQAIMSWKLKTQMVMLSKYREPIYLQPLIKQGVPYVVGVNGFRYGTVWQYLETQWKHFHEGLQNYQEVLSTAAKEIFDDN